MVDQNVKFHISHIFAHVWSMKFLQATHIKKKSKTHNMFHLRTYNKIIAPHEQITMMYRFKIKRNNNNNNKIQCIHQNHKQLNQSFFFI